MDYLDYRRDFLAHHGIKGQKWGVRRYQNDDGTYTKEGMKRYGVNDFGQMSREGKKQYKKDIKEEAKSVRKSVKEFDKENKPKYGEDNWEVSKRISKGANFIEKKYSKASVEEYKKQQRGRALMASGAAFVVAVGANIALVAMANN